MAILTSLNTPYESVSLVKEILSKENVSIIPNFSEVQTSDNKVFPETIERQIVKFVASKVIYPEEAKSAGLQGVPIVKISTGKGVIKSTRIIEKNDELNVPLLDKIIVVAYAKSDQHYERSKSE